MLYDKPLLKEIKCAECNEAFHIPTIFDYCINCNEKHKTKLLSSLDFSKVKNSFKWRQRKKNAYMIIICFSVYGFIWYKFGIVTEAISSITFIIGIFADDILKFLCDIF